MRKPKYKVSRMFPLRSFSSCSLIILASFEQKCNLDWGLGSSIHEHVIQALLAVGFWPFFKKILASLILTHKLYFPVSYPVTLQPQCFPMSENFSDFSFSSLTFSVTILIISKDLWGLICHTPRPWRKRQLEEIPHLVNFFPPRTSSQFLISYNVIEE